MAYEQRDNSGALFRIPDGKRTTEKHPEYDGDFKIVCPHCQGSFAGKTSAWVRETKAGAKFFSLSFRSKPNGGAE